MAVTRRLITLLTCVPLLIVAPVARADGEAPGVAPVALSAARTSYDPPPGPGTWDGLRDTLAVQRWYYAVLARPKPVAHHSRVAVSRRGGGGSVAACIGARENGGSYGRSSNPTHFGKYQYDRQTWVAHGGNPEDWGTASPAEQDRVFAQGTAQYGYGAWQPYDGC